MIATFLAAAIAASPVHAKLVLPRAGVVGGQPAAATVVVTGRIAAAPRVTFTALTETVTAVGRRTRAGRYSLRFRLPVGGEWTYRIATGRRLVGNGRFAARVESRLPQAAAAAVCARAGAFWPTETLALDSGSAWIACKEAGALVRLDLASLRATAVLRLGGADLIGVTTGFGSVWALDGNSGTLSRIEPDGNRVSARIRLPASKPYNVWTGAGAVWVADDGGAAVVRIDAATNRPVATIGVGDGPADLAFDGDDVYVIDHRDRTLFRIDARTNQSRLVATIPGDAPERIVRVDGHLWITGRGTDLLEVDPTSGAVLRTVEIGAGGIDLVAAGDTIWVPSRNNEVDARGFPTMEALRRVDASTGAVTSSLAARAPLDVHGLAADAGGVWLADNTHGVLYRVAG